MKEQIKYDPGHSHPSHLDENELALFAEFLRHEREELPAGLREHVETCAHCRAEVMAITDMLEEVGRQEDGHKDFGYQMLDVGFRMSDVGYPESKIQNPKSKIVTRHVSRMSRFTPVIRIVASLAAVIFLALIIQRFRNDKPGTEMVSGPDTPGFQENISEPADTLLLAQAYVPDSTLEVLIHATYRTAHNPQPRGPSNHSAFHTGDTLTITWIPEVGDTYSLIILNNRQEQQTEINTGQTSSLKWKIELTPGLYYWKFQTRDELWHVGKFMVLESSN